MSQTRTFLFAQTASWWVSLPPSLAPSNLSHTDYSKYVSSHSNSFKTKTLQISIWPEQILPISAKTLAIRVHKTRIGLIECHLFEAYFWVHLCPLCSFSSNRWAVDITRESHTILPICVLQALLSLHFCPLLFYFFNLCSASSLYSVTTVNLHHAPTHSYSSHYQQVAMHLNSPRTLEQAGLSCYNFYIIFYSHLLLFLYSAFQVLTNYPPSRSVERGSSLLPHQSSTNRLPTFSQYIPDTSQICHCFIIPSNMTQSVLIIFQKMITMVFSGSHWTHFFSS